jgi:hypothetical protein
MKLPRRYSRAEVEALLEALERNADGVVAAAQDATGQAGFEPYLYFCERCDDFDTLTILIEHRLRRIDGGKAQDLERRFDELKVFMLAATLQASLHFLRLFAVRDALPLGSRDVFARELRYLNGLQARIGASGLAERLDERTAADLQEALAMLDEIMDRAPALLDLGLAGDEPTLRHDGRRAALAEAAL